MSFAGDPDVEPPKRVGNANRGMSFGPTQEQQNRMISAEKMHEALANQLEAMRDWKKMDDHFREYLRTPEATLGHRPPAVIKPMHPGMPFLPQPEEIEEAHDRSKHTAWGNYKIWLRNHLRRK